MKRFRLGYAILATTLFMAAGTWYELSRGFSTRNPPNAIESFVAPRMRNMAIPRAARNARNPIASSPEVMDEAMAHFADHCATCHGNDGSGQTQIGKGLYPKPPDMKGAGTQGLSDGDIYYIIRNGVRFTGMPAFGEESDAPDDDSWKLVVFIRHLPSMTPEEVQHMDEMTPKSPMEMDQEEEIRKFLQGDDSAPADAHKHHH